MRALITTPDLADLTTAEQVTETDLDRLYTRERILRLNFVATLDGAATGPDGRSGTINSTADHRGFAAMRRAADVILIGAGTVRAEQYGPSRTPVVVVSHRPELPPSIRDSDRVVLATSHASGAQESPTTWICGQESVDLGAVVERARQTFGPHVLSEGGPHLAGELIAADLVDELALSWTPRLVGGTRVDHPRILEGSDVEVELSCRHLLEECGTLLGLWRIER
ncbi:dihydrofolate reductase family protein [Janibacter corallicola]|uniref:dihydrofolate reductase family protein n=1 Tax=Janibacter corallicola TaxID=415212 RepID=UPI000834A4AD|nr:dihydrofolate reductase family protein [Janibacter corallicola]